MKAGDGKEEEEEAEAKNYLKRRQVKRSKQQEGVYGGGSRENRAKAIRAIDKEKEPNYSVRRYIL